MKKPVWELEELDGGDLLVKLTGGGTLHITGIGRLSESPKQTSSKQISSKQVNALIAHSLSRARQAALNANLSTLASIGGRLMLAAEAREVKPPRLAENIYAVFASKTSVDAQLGDFQEIFEGNVKRFGPERARRLYWIHMGREIGPLLFHKLKRLGIIGIIIDYGRTKLGL